MVPQADTTELASIIELLAGTNELFRPIRLWTDSRQVCAVVERRERYHRGGQPYHAGGDEAGRKQAERVADELESSGVVVFQRRRKKRVFWKLSDAADWGLRALVGLRGWEPMVVAMLAIREHHNTGTTSVAETWLAGPEAWGTPQGAALRTTVEAMLSAALVRNLVTAWSDRVGCVSYRLTDQGRAYLNAPTLPPADLPRFDDGAADVYDRASEHAEAEPATPSRENVSVIPLSAGLWPSAEDRAAIPFVLTRKGEPRSLESMIRAILRTGK